MPQNIKPRVQAFALHLLISAAVFLSLFSLILTHWFPGELIHFGVWEGVRIVAGVDLILGPLLTLVIFDKAKKSLNLDLSVIAAIQISALAYGVYVLEKERPMIQVVLDGSLYIISKADFLEYDIPLDTFNEYEGKKPYPVALNLPNNRDAMIQNIIQKSVENIQGGAPIEYDHNLYLPLRSSDENTRIRKKLEWIKSKLEIDTQNACYWLDLRALRAQGKACFSFEEYEIKKLSPRLKNSNQQ